MTIERTDDREEEHIYLFHSVYAYYSRFFLTMECRNGKFFQKSHRNGKVDAFLERKDENQDERVWKAWRFLGNGIVRGACRSFR